MLQARMEPAAIWRATRSAFASVPSGKTVRSPSVRFGRPESIFSTFDQEPMGKSQDRCVNGATGFFMKPSVSSPACMMMSRSRSSCSVDMTKRAVRASSFQEAGALAAFTRTSPDFT